MATTDGRPVPIKNTAYRLTFTIFDNDGDPIASATGLDSEVSKDGAAMADCTNEATYITGSAGGYYLDLTATEMNADTVYIEVKHTVTDGKTQCFTLNPQEAGDIKIDLQTVAGTTLNTNSAQIGVNIVNAGGTGWNSGAITSGTFAASSITNTALSSTFPNKARYSGTGGTGGSSSQYTFPSGSSAVNDYYKGAWLELTSGAGAGQTRLITGYNGTTRVATITPNWATNPDGTTVFNVLQQGNIEAALVVTGAVGSVTGTVGSVTGNVGGNVVGSVASVTGNVGGNVVGSVASVTGNVGGNVTGSVASVTGAVGSVTGNVGGSVASVTGNVGGNVVGSVGSVIAPVTGTISGTVNANVIQISGDAGVADSLKALLDSTGANLYINDLTVSNNIGIAGDVELSTLIINGNATIGASLVITGGISATTLNLQQVNVVCPFDEENAVNINGNGISSNGLYITGTASGASFTGVTTGIQADILGNITGNLTGSVGSVALNGITNNSLAASAITEIQAGLMTSAAYVAPDNDTIAAIGTLLVDVNVGVNAMTTTLNGVSSDVTQLVTDMGSVNNNLTNINNSIAALPEAPTVEAIAAQVETILTASHGAGSWVGGGGGGGTGPTAAEIAEAVDAVLTAAHGLGPWTDSPSSGGSTAAQIAEKVELLLSEKHGDGSWRSYVILRPPKPKSLW